MHNGSANQCQNIVKMHNKSQILCILFTLSEKYDTINLGDANGTNESKKIAN